MASLRGLSCLVLLAVVAALVGADESMKMGRSEVKIAARAGTMQFRRQRLNKNGSVTDMKPVNIRMAQMVQLDKDFKEVTNCTVPSRRRRSMSGQEGKPGQGEITGHGDMPGGDGNSTFDPSKGGIAHRARTWAGENGMGKGKRFSDFDKQEFEVGKKQEGVKLRHSTLKAATRRFSANLGAHVGQLAIDLAMPEADGEIDIDGEKQKLKKGDMKFNIALDSWQWCGEEDAEGAAAFLDVYVEVNSTLQPTLKRARSASSPATFDLGDNATMSFSGKCQRDNGTWTDIEDGFPKIDDEDPSLIIVRFKRFSDSLLYDPTVSEEDSDEDGGSNGASGLTMSAMLISMATVLTYISV